MINVNIDEVFEVRTKSMENMDRRVFRKTIGKLFEEEFVIEVVFDNTPSSDERLKITNDDYIGIGLGQ